MYSTRHTGFPEITWAFIGSNSNITETGTVEYSLYKMLESTVVHSFSFGNVYVCIVTVL